MPTIITATTQKELDSINNTLMVTDHPWIYPETICSDGSNLSLLVRFLEEESVRECWRSDDSGNMVYNRRSGILKIHHVLDYKTSGDANHDQVRGNGVSCRDNYVLLDGNVFNLQAKVSELYISLEIDDAIFDEVIDYVVNGAYMLWTPESVLTKEEFADMIEDIERGIAESASNSSP